MGFRRGSRRWSPGGGASYFGLFRLWPVLFFRTMGGRSGEVGGWGRQEVEGASYSGQITFRPALDAVWAICFSGQGHQGCAEVLKYQLSLRPIFGPGLFFFFLKKKKKKKEEKGQENQYRPCLGGPGKERGRSRWRRSQLGPTLRVFFYLPFYFQSFFIILFS